MRTRGAMTAAAAAAAAAVLWVAATAATATTATATAAGVTTTTGATIGGGGAPATSVALPFPTLRRAAPRPRWARDASVHLGMSLAPFCDTSLTHAQLATSIRSMRDAGVRHVSINVFGTQATEWASAITYGTSADCAVTTPMVRWLVRRVHAAGMRVFLKPHVDLANGHWRGEIRPSAAWFASYRAFIWSWAVVARQEGVATFSVGVEKKRTLGHVGEWLRIIKGVRARFPGEVTYCSNWDSYMAVSPKMWRELDFIGINAYFPLRSTSNDGKPSPMVRQLRDAWEGHAAHISSWKGRIGLPAKRVIFTEAGFKSIANSVQQPYAWRATSGVPVDLKLQRDAYDALMSTMSRYAWWKGVYWWTWEHRQLAFDGDRGYSPQHKPAEGVVRFFYKRRLRAPLHIRIASFERGTAGWTAVPLPTPRRRAAKRRAASAKGRARAAARKRRGTKATATPRKGKGKAKSPRRRTARWLTPLTQTATSRAASTAAARAHRARSSPRRRLTVLRATPPSVTSMGVTHGRRALLLRRTGDGRRWDATARLGNDVASAVAWATARGREGPSNALPLLEMDVTFAARPAGVWARSARGRGPPPWAGLRLAIASTGARERSWALRVAGVSSARDGAAAVTQHVAMPLRTWPSLVGKPRGVVLTLGLEGSWGGDAAALTVYIDNLCVTRMSRIPPPWE
ncbi:hypothetical protein BU14_0517s0012 [Porphyra umbilicalis]|uniref:Glycoside hydrolase family 5 domain-containing protein n=1 Tax=Porphyra umbilicalis TaxID=2786 RepID=A0A1X6NSQ8_PORUM|nr:hypothetical protein BU14_0517s0012 [Porphyra umbilicalis]|eukprot:OSX71642.1 hypothetical protein BU14_0517s0012 [Porphyra umbilicalis]